MLTFIVLVVSAKRSFSTLKIIKINLRLTMSQERLNKLILLYIEKEMFNEITNENLINNFV